MLFRDEIVYMDRKRGKDCAIGKVVWAQPLNCYVYATPYKDRVLTQIVSVPPAVLWDVRRRGAEAWVVRHDLTGRCWMMPMDMVDTVGWLHKSEGQEEWFVELEKFCRSIWQSWNYVEREVRVEDLVYRERVREQVADPRGPVQPALF